MSEQSGTRLESHGRLIGEALLLAFDDVGTIEGITVEARHIMSDKGGSTFGALVTVQKDEYSSANAFIDEDELSELLEAFTRFEKVNANPTRFKFFEMQYKTRGDFKIVVFNDSKGRMRFMLQAAHCSRMVEASSFKWIKGMLVAAEKKINEVSSSVQDREKVRHPID